MVQVTYPIPYLMRARVRGQSRMIDVADEIVREIGEVDDFDAPVVLTCKIAGPSKNIWQPVCDREAVFRYYEGHFYTPCMVVSKTFQSVVERQLAPQDLANLAQQETFWATAFGNQYPHQSGLNGKNSLPAERLRKYQAGELPRLETLPVRGSEVGSQGRAAKIAEAEADLAKYICVDGKLWRQTRGEPIIRYSRLSRGHTMIYLDEAHAELQQHEFKGSFRIDRMEDCLDHVASLTKAEAGSPDDIIFQIADIRLDNEAAFTFDDEKDSILRLAKRLFDPLYYQAVVYEDTMSDDQRAAVLDMKGALEGESDEDAERLTKIIRDFAADWPLPKFPLPFDVPLLLERWDLRPTMASAGMTI